ncbi:TonB-dependent receptor [Spongiibacter sp. KMU-166]|uniref:TonB-dependent receptor n=1 Tax=Spongiibacter thalassae TaxID=2721624 RepID=A0ABX1GDA0_9GAMM|nr:TonB-dependent receptor [Spongiibacter thalassae]NKI16477.1 TonB-dependent receptor [Spongiibacter thalassae]
MVSVTKRSKVFYTSALSAGILAASGLAYAQSPAETTKKESLTLEEVLVSARRSEEGAQNVPVTVDVLDTDGLREATIVSTTDLQQNVPGIFLGGSGGPQNPLYVIRGQSKGLIGTTSPAVVSYYAEVPQPSWGSAVPQYDMANIQVLKGPQGTLFGRNTTGGAILYSPAAPEHEFSGFINGTLGRHKQTRLQGAVNIPLIKDQLAARVAADFHKRDGYVKNIGEGDDLEAIDTESFRISLLADYGALRNTFIYDSFSSDNDGFNIHPQTVYEPSALNQLGIAEEVKADVERLKALGPLVNDSAFDQHERNDRITIVNRTEFDFNDNVSLLNLFGYQETDLDYAPNIDGLGLYKSPAVEQGLMLAFGPAYQDSRTSIVKARLIDKTKQLSNELQLRGTAFDSRMEWLLGAFYLKNEPDEIGQINGTTVAQTQYETSIPGMEVGYTNGGAQHFFLTDESRALFARTEYDLSETLAVEVGVRYTEDEFELCLGSDTKPQWLGSDPTYFDEAACRRGDTDVIVNSAVVTESSEALTWTLGLNWQATDDVFAYGVLRHGYRAGGANGPIFSGDLASYQTFKPEEVDDLELGVKADWNINEIPVRTNLSYFYGKYENAQADLAGGVTTARNCTPTGSAQPGVDPDGDCSSSNDPTGGAIVFNIGDTSVKGVDMEVTARFTQSLTVSVNATVQDADIDKIYDQPNAYIDAKVSSAIPFLYFTNSVVQANVNYSIPMGKTAEELSLNMNYYKTSAADKGDTDIPAYDLVNVRADLYNIAAANVDVGVFVNNVFDEEYAISSSISSRALGLDSFVFGPPRLFGVDVRYNF